MRITQGQIAQINKSTETAKTDKLQNLVGKTISGTIVDVKGNQLTLSQEGKLIVLLNDSSAKFVVNQNVQLLITGSDEGTYLAKPVQTDSESAHVQTALDRLGVFGDPQNKEIVKAMLSASVPLTQENYNLMKQNLNSVTTFINELNNQPEYANSIDSSKSLKDNIVAFLTQTPESSQSVPQSRLESQLPIQNTQTALQNDQVPVQNSQTALQSTQAATIAEQFTQILNLPNGADQIESLNAFLNQHNLEELPQTLGPLMSESNQSKLKDLIQSPVFEVMLNETSPEIKERLEGLIQLLPNQNSMNQQVLNDTLKLMMTEFVNKMDSTASTEFAEIAKAVASMFDLKDDAVMTKGNIELSLNNIFMLNQLKVTEMSVGSSFIHLTQILKALNLNENQLLELNEILKLDIKEDQKLFRLADFMKQNSEDESVKKQIDKEVVFIKEGSQLVKQTNEPMFFMQLPLKIEDYERPVEFFFKKKAGGESKEDFTILIALHTNNYKEVRCVIEKVGEQFKLNFKLENDAIKKTFESRSGELLKRLQVLDKKIVALNYTSKTEENFFEDTIVKTGFDIKI